MEHNVELRRRRQTANPIVSNKPDVEYTFNSSKLGVRVRPNDRKVGLWVAAITDEAPDYVRQHVDANSQIISVNGVDLLNMPFQEAVEHFAQLNLPVTVRFRPPLYPTRSKSDHRHGHHGHHHHHHHHHDSDDDDDEQDGTCFIACYIILFVLFFMFVVSVSLNGFPSIPRSLPSFSLFRRNKGSYRRKGSKGSKQQMFENDAQNAQNAQNGPNAAQDGLNLEMLKKQAEKRDKQQKSRQKAGRRLQDIGLENYADDTWDVERVLRDIDAMNEKDFYGSS